MYGTADVVVSHLLAQYEALRDDAGLNQTNPSLSFCGASSVTLPNDNKMLPKIFTRKHLGPSGCTQGTSGYFDMPYPASLADLGKDGTGWG
jgi:hypothetical protein